MGFGVLQFGVAAVSHSMLICLPCGMHELAGKHSQPELKDAQNHDEVSRRMQAAKVRWEATIVARQIGGE